MNEAPLQPQALSTYVYAPTNVAFMHTSGTQFTHFSESKAGNRTTFGLSCEQLLELAKPAMEKFSQQNRSSADRVVRQYLNELSTLSNTLACMVEDFKRGSSLGERAKAILTWSEGPKPSYSTDYDAAKAVVDSGHIPIMLSAILPATQYARAARTVEASDVQYYFGKMVGSRQQCREYLVKQDMMKAIAAFRTKINLGRCSLPGGEALSFCNSLIKMLDDEIINPNRKSLPANCETFDLYDTFVTKLSDLYCQIPNKPEYKDFIFNLQNALRARALYGYTTYHYQEKVSDEVYAVLINFVHKHVGLSKDSESVKLTAARDDHLQAVLPMIEYINSAVNPFARDGLFGELVRNEFHNIALGAYAEHESKMKINPTTRYEYFARTSSHPKFNNDQVAKLLFGSEETAEDEEVDKKGQGKESVGFLGRLMLEGSTSENTKSDSDRRSAMLELPMPQRYENLLTHVAPPPAAAASSSPLAPAAASSTPDAVLPKIYGSPVAAPKGPSASAIPKASTGFVPKP
jgi:hypothetical protein